MDNIDKQRLEQAGMQIIEPSDSIHSLTTLRCPLCGQTWTWPVARAVTEQAMLELLKHFNQHSPYRLEEEPRCTAVENSIRCDLPEGHAGAHCFIPF